MDFERQNLQVKVVYTNIKHLIFEKINSVYLVLGI